MVVSFSTTINTGNYQIILVYEAIADATITVKGATLTINSAGSTSTNVGYSGEGNAIKLIGIADKETSLNLYGTRFYTSSAWNGET